MPLGIIIGQARKAAGALLGSLALSGLVTTSKPLDAQEFTQQSLVVVPFRADGGAGSTDDAHKISNGVRGRLGKLIPEREADVLSNTRLNALLVKSSYRRNAAMSELEMQLAAAELRADEVLFGRVAREGRTWVVHARLARMRNWRMQQPMPAVRATSADGAIEQLSAEVVKARAQLTGLRRCENALQKNDYAGAAKSAELAIRAYPRAVIARDCLIAALRDGITGADSLLRVADDALAIDSSNTFAEVARAQSLEALKRPRDAVAEWNRIFAQHHDSLSLGVSVVEALLRLQQPRTALDDAHTLEKKFGVQPELRRLRFRALSQQQLYAQAAHLGDSLEFEDAAFRADSAYTVRHVDALRQAGDSLGALEMGVRAVRRFPGDARLYLQYLQILNGEQPAALPRGVARFPDLPELRLLVAREARRTGNRRVAIRETHAAIARDSSLATQYLALADLLLEENRADSALYVLSRAPRNGDQLETVRSYVMARGLQLLRASADTAPARQRIALGMLLLADSVDSREDSRATVAAASLQVARTYLVDAFRTNTCADVQRADVLLAQSAQVMARGMGTGGNIAEITAAYDALRKATTDALMVRCKTASGSLF